MAQSHNCAFLDEKCQEECHANEYCQYQLNTGPTNGRMFCGKDQMTPQNKARPDQEEKIAALTLQLAEVIKVKDETIVSNRIALIKANKENVALKTALAEMQKELANEREIKVSLVNTIRTREERIVALQGQFDKMASITEKIDTQRGALRKALKEVL